MRVGALVAGRFRIERIAGRGGNGAVFRALDEQTGLPVALKFALSSIGADLTRFTREAQVLAELQHPGIVRYVAHGTTEAGNYFLAMEWIEGDDLWVRLAFNRLRVRESVALMRQVAEALAVAHKKGVIHRDIKPSNLLLVDNDLSKVKIVDFGLARYDSTVGVTRTGIAIGTPGYMAPEQARGKVNIDARADVFSMGCVFYQCLTGLPPFFAEHTTAVLAKIVIEDAPPIRALCEDVPEALDDLIARMLAKDRDARPADAGRVAEELGKLGPLDVAKPQLVVPVAARPSRLTGTEQRLSSVVFASSPNSAIPIATGREEQLEGVMGGFGGRLDRLADGSLVVSFADGGTPIERAVNAARCALAVRDVLPDATIALATGWKKPGAPSSDPTHPMRPVARRRQPKDDDGDATTERPAPLAVGDLIDRAARVLSQRPRAVDDGSHTHRIAQTGKPVAVDETTAGLLRTRFDVERMPDGFAIWGERDPIDAPKTLLGKRTDCVGRDVELNRLETTFDTCVSASTPRAIIITGAPGIGKSRLAQEFVRRLRDSKRSFQVWTARGDPRTTASAYGLIAQALAREAGLLDGEALEERQHKLRARVSRRRGNAASTAPGLAEADVARITEVLGELVGAPVAEDDRTQVRSTRPDSAGAPADQVSKAWEDLLRMECAALPVVLVLEDLQWGDRPSMNLVEGALRNLSSSPLFVIATGRPELFDAHPSIWSDRGVGRLELGELGRDASEQLVRKALSHPPPPNVIARIVDRAGGHAFFLEELVRAIAEGRGGALPQSVLAMVQARLDQLDAEARRVLRAASIFGQMFWARGVASLVGSMSNCDEVLMGLEARELIVPHEPGRFPGEREFAFRNETIRDAAYAMLTESDRALGHRMAAQWLERAGETNALVLAEHHERGGNARRAVPFYIRAAEQALGGNDLVTVLSLAEKAIASGAVGEELGALRQLEASAHFWRGELAEAETSGLEAMRLFPRGSERWCLAAADVAVATGKLGNFDRLIALVEAIRVQDRKLAAKGMTTVEIEIALGHAAQQLLMAGRYDEADAIIKRLEGGGPSATRDPAVVANLEWAIAVGALVAGDIATYVNRLEVAIEQFQRAGEVRTVCTLLVSTGYAHLERGAYAEAERVLLDALATSERLGLPNVTAAAKHNLGLAVARQGRVEEGRAWEQQAIEAFRAQGDRRLEGAAQVYLARIQLLAWELAAAEHEARAAIATLESSPPGRAVALAALANVLLVRASVRGEEASRSPRLSEALKVACDGAELLGTLGGTVEGQSYILLMRAEALAAIGDHERARVVIGEAQQHLLRRANKIADRAARASFLTEVPENARTLALASAWLSG